MDLISFGAVSIVFFISLALPSVPGHRTERQTQIGILNDGTTEEGRLTQDGINEDMTLITRAEIEKRKLDNGLKLYFITIGRNFSIYKKNKIVLKWSIWWALASCGMYQIYNYMQTLWMAMQSDPNKVENGIAECANTFFGNILSN
uniref:Uncharacterized protein n=1 Tax=Heterorhabditis bacteriophora TaxID=37862 RepID=A0A1I7X4T2_HETBA